jgi:A/G-specific adenine glycosylase
LKARLRRALLRWYDAHKRDLAWRRRVSPYRTWVSEIMLQQTTVATVVPYYERFLKRFPDVQALAAAPEDEVLKLWAGLGYYSRARNLRRAAQEIVTAHGGDFPSDPEAILALPGIGRYTAGAILSIAFGKPAPLVDGNVIRLFARLFAVRENVKKAETLKRFWSIAEDLIDANRPGDWNQALMELGATVCSPESPSCGACPAATLCAAKAQGIQDELPVVDKRRAPVPLTWKCVWVEKGGRVLLWKRSEDERFLKSHWGLPESRHLKVEPGPRLRTIRHSITHHRITVDVHQALEPGELPPAARWSPKSRLNERLVSSLWRKAAGLS